MIPGNPDPPLGTPNDDHPPEPIDADIAAGADDQPPAADAPEPDELAELEQFLADIREAMDPDSRLEDDLQQWKETPNDIPV